MIVKFSRLLALIVAASVLAISGGKKPLTFADMMHFKKIDSPAISDDGNWVVHAEQPDRGDGTVRIYSVESGRTRTFERGSKPVLTNNGLWMACALLPSAAEVESATDEKDKPRPGMLLLNNSSGDTLAAGNVQRFEFSEDSRWLIYLLAKEEKKGKKSTESDSSANDAGKKAKKGLGSDLIIRDLASANETRISCAVSFAIDSLSRHLAIAIADTFGERNALLMADLDRPAVAVDTVIAFAHGEFTNLSWNDRRAMLAFLADTLTKDEKSGEALLWLWENGKASLALEDRGVPNGWMLPAKNQLQWTKDGERLFLGLKKESAEGTARDGSVKEDAGQKFFDEESILAKRTLDVWHWNDPLIIPHQKKRWKDVKDQTYRSVLHLDTRELVQLADTLLPNVAVVENPATALGKSEIPYLKQMTWEGYFEDVYTIDLATGDRKKIITRLDGTVSLSPGGGYAVYFQKKHWHLYDVASGTTTNLTEKLEVPFYDEDDDTPDPPGDYGVAGWIDGDRAVLIYDKYDIWQFRTAESRPINLTKGTGRTQSLRYRVQKLDKEAPWFKSGERLLLTGYHDTEKYTGVFSAVVGSAGVEKLVVEPKRYSILGKAQKADALLFTRENYDEFPDLWMSDMRLGGRRKISNANPQMHDFAWGSAELVEWSSLDGIPLQGVLIKPGNYVEGRRYPVLVYYYERFSQRLHEFDEVVINHRPCFPFYASNGYAVFLPDVRFEIGRPGFSATKCVVPGVQKLIAMGIADPKAIGLHGHSWSGYETAFIITQTDIFAAAIAGAPVSNMTSAYSGIRRGSGLARQFQYEQQQSRIGGSLWEYPERYIANSPVFFADRIRTPLLIEFGDEDDAVPWEQGIEMYLAMRRLGKNCIMLQYRNEPHHLKKYANKLDYSIKFKQYLDHYLKGEPAPDWMREGVEYKGE